MICTCSGYDAASQQFVPCRCSPPFVIMESPFDHDDPKIMELFAAYADRSLGELIKEGLSPFASHMIYTRALDDRDPAERKLGIEAGLALYKIARKCIVFQRYGISPGMQQGIDRAKSLCVPVEYR